MIPNDLELCGLTRFECCHLIEHVARITNRVTFDTHQNVSRMNARSLRRSSLQESRDQRATGILQPKRARQFRGDILDFHTDPAARHATVLDDFIHDLTSEADGDTESDALGSSGLGINGTVDSDQVACTVYQGSARIAWIDGRIGLDEIFERIDPQATAP